MEKLIRKRIVDHMNSNDLFSDKQFGFIGARSTNLQLLRVMDHWTSILDQGGEIDTIYTDFMKAFDKVPHKRLIYKLEKYGISKQTCKWVQNFLTNRKQRVQVYGSYSQWHDVTSGIPQGSVLGPILFVVFINDLPKCVNSSVFMFADDTKIYREISTKNDQLILQDDLNKLFEWSNKWLLKFHPDKCKILQISTKTPEIRSYTMPKYEGGLVSLERVENEKDVGVTINSKLKFDEHIQNQVNKANKMMGLIRRSFKFLDFRSFRLLFKSIVRPHLEYASSVWSPSKIKDIDSIENVQRRATKMLPKLKDKSYEERLKLIKLPTLKFRRLRGDMIETYKILNNIYDKRTTVGIFTLNTNTNRGHPLKLLKQRCARDIRKNFFSNRIVNIWNNLPSCYRHIQEHGYF